MKAASGSYYVLVVEEEGEGRVVGAATLVLERKFIHNCGQVTVWVVSGVRCQVSGVRCQESIFFQLVGSSSPP